LIVDHDLAVEDVATGRKCQLREVARQRLATPRLKHALVAVNERDRAESVVLRLVDPLLADRELGLRASELGIDRRFQRQRHEGPMLPRACLKRSRGRIGPLATIQSMAAHATVAEEDYLQTLYWLFEAGLPMTG